jgi:hypothetical protein
LYIWYNTAAHVVNSTCEMGINKRNINFYSISCDHIISQLNG